MPQKKSTHPGLDANPIEGSTSEELCLMGPRHLSSHLRFGEESAAAGEQADPSKIAQFWRAAAAIYRQLEVTEAGAADDPQIEHLPVVVQRHVDKLIEMPVFRTTFDTVPVAFGMVELDKLIVSQYYITRAIAERLRASCVPPISNKVLAELCLPTTPPGSDFKLAGKDSHEFVFVSGSHDMRFLGATLVDPASVTGLSVQGHVKAVVALSVGFSTNLLNAVRFGNRVVLNDGHHRAYALRAMGLTHVPCVIQVCGSYEEVRLAATPEIYDNSDLYFESPRPPLLRDFDRPDLACRLLTERLRRQVNLRFKVESRALAI